MVTNNRCEQIKSDTVENVPTGGVNNGEFGKVGRNKISRASSWMEFKLEELEKTEHLRNDEEKHDQDDENCASQSQKASQGRYREQHAILSNVGQEDRHVLWIDDVTGKELPWHEVRQAREQELKYLRDLGVYQKVRDRRRAGAVGSNSTQQTHVASCRMFVPQSRSSRFYIHRERVVSKDVKHHATELGQGEEDSRTFENPKTLGGLVQ